MPLVKKIWLLTSFQIQWVCFFRYYDSHNVIYSKTICSQIFTYVPSHLLRLQKTNIIRDYLEDINEIPKSRMFWPRQIWSKYVNKLEVWLYKNFYLFQSKSLLHLFLPHFMIITWICKTWGCDGETAFIAYWYVILTRVSFLNICVWLSNV
jgi:hypothetical protein